MQNIGSIMGVHRFSPAQALLAGRRAKKVALVLEDLVELWASDSSLDSLPPIFQLSLLHSAQVNTCFSRFP